MNNKATDSFVRCLLSRFLLVSCALLSAEYGGTLAANAAEGTGIVVPPQPTTEQHPLPAQPLAAVAEDSPHEARRLTAIFSANHDPDKSLDAKLPAFEEFISSRITEKGFSVISREVATDAVSALLKDSKQTEIDRMLANNASVLRLSQMLGAKYIIMASINTYDADKETTEAYGVKIVNVTHTLRVAYKILDGVQGGSLAGATVEVSSTKRYTEVSRSESTGTLNALLNKAAVQIAESAGTKLIPTVLASTRLAEFSVACGMQDLAQLPLGVPNICLTANNTVVIEKLTFPVLALNVMVELDGAGIGSTPTVFKVPPGLHKIRLRRDGFRDYEGTISVNQGQTFNIALQMTDAGYQRWKDNIAFLNSIENGKKLTDAEAEKLRGEAQRLRQSGYMVNINSTSKEDIKVNTTENVKLYKSIF